MTASEAWELDAEHEDFRASVRAFVDRQVRPVVEEAEEKGRPPAALLKEMGSAGLLGLAVPEEYGGGAGDSLAIVVLSEELARASGGIAVTALVTGYMSTPHIAKFGTEAQCARYLPSLVAGREDRLDRGHRARRRVQRGWHHHPRDPGRAAGSGSTARRCSSPTRASPTWSIVAARTSPDGHRGITTFMVEGTTRAWPWASRCARWAGTASDTREVVLSDCFVPADAVLGDGGPRASTRSCPRSSWSGSRWPGWALGHAAECLAAGDRVRQGPRRVRRTADQQAGHPAPPGRAVDRTGGGPSC